jgi:hypothetical protein
MDFLEDQPENKVNPPKAGETFNRFNNFGFTLVEWKGMAFKLLNWRIKNIDGEMSPQKRRSAR